MKPNMKITKLEFARKEVKKCQQALLEFVPERPVVSKTIFGEIVQADPKTSARNSERIANLTYNFLRQ